MSAGWNELGFDVGMPHMAPGHKLSEVEFYKALASQQWGSIAKLLDRPVQEIVSADGERLYGSYIGMELCFGEDHSPERFGEGASVHLHNRIGVFAERFIEGFTVFDDAPIAASHLEKIHSLDDLRSQGLPYAYSTNALIARVAGNSRLKIFKPAGIEHIGGPALTATPEGIVDQRAAQSTGLIKPFSDQKGIALIPQKNESVRYKINFESDLNGAGLTYFVRYAAMMNYAERIFLTEHLSPPVSADFNACLSTEHRRTYFFGNAAAGEEVEILVSAQILPPEQTPLAVLSSGHRKLLRILFRIDLYRGSDKTLMASCLVRKAAHVPGDANHVLMEVERLLARISAAS